ncbi:uncharacterized protein LOC135100727 [Scylla paramamosain]|uniref:uncharacterized protein LOC135100727 n=1 Tax=Scylla paramamosain TaxID=85552 RepID=UPI003083B3CE
MTARTCLNVRTCHSSSSLGAGHPLPLLDAVISVARWTVACKVLPCVRTFVLAAPLDTPVFAMIKLLQAGAVPFGFASDMSDVNSPYHRRDCLHALQMNWRHDHRPQADGFRLLPDIITSNTPPPSPLPRSHSCLTFFPEKTQRQTSLAAPASSSILHGSDVDEEARLSHVLEVRRHVHSDAPSTSTAHLPHLTWVLPHLPSSSRVPANDGEVGRRRGREEDGEKQRLWRQIGGDLRKMADQFEVSSKSSAEVAVLPSSLPVMLTRCVAGTLLCLVWWRLYHCYC